MPYIDRFEVLQPLVEAWIMECCVRTPAARSAPRELYLSFEPFARQRSPYAWMINPKGLGETLDRLGFKRYRTGGNRYWLSLAVKSN